MTAINPFSALSNLGQADKSRTSIAGNFDTFLSLLTTQLKNQNPLDPLDTNQFTEQLVSFSQVEQSVQQNENLEQLLKLSAANAITGAVGYIGKEVSGDGSKGTLQNGAAQWDYQAQSGTTAGTFTVTDADGQTVYTETRPIAQGNGTFTWNGLTGQGAQAPAGSYTLSISSDNASTVTTSFSGIVDGVDLSGNDPVLLSNGRQFRLDEVTSIRTPSDG